MSHRQPFLNIHTEGALLPSDLLSRLVEGTNLAGLKPEDYHLGAGEKLNEAISRSWTRLLSLWLGFRKAQAALPTSDLGTTLTRERWLLQLFQELGYGRLIVARSFEIDGKTYPISHIWQGQHYQVPIHLVSCRADLDKRSEQRIHGASKASPHGMLQEFLNRSEFLWAFASNGLKLLILRDNASLTRQAHVEFDLEGIFDGEAFADFRLLWLLCHQSRLEGTAKDRPETCWLETWSKQAQTDGRRALDQLRVGVQKALENLGTGFIAHKANQGLRDRLQAGTLQKQNFYRQLLRLVYRLIFLFVAEDRDLLHFPGASDEARSRYSRFYSGQRLRRMAERTRGGRHADLWVGLRLVFAKLGDDHGCPELGLPALGGFLFGPEAMRDLETAGLSNEHLLQAIRNLGLVKDRSGWRLVDYRNLGSEELGSVYESLLELNPTMEVDAGVFSLGIVAGNQRKTSGTYYTPDSLVQCLLDSALDPVVEQAIKGKTAAEAEKAILALKVCDPAVGSGHFLVGAAHRLAKHLASVRAQALGESEPSPLYYQHALRDVIGHCLYGVDINPMAAELCRVSLWLEAIEPGKPLSFLDHHIRVGNSLLGATPALLAKGIPDEAFTPIEGDDKEICSRFKRVNKDERAGQRRLFAATTEPWERLGDLAASMAHLDNAPDDCIEAIRKKERMYEAMVRSGNYIDVQFWADTWCAAFVWKKTQEFSHPITEVDFRRIGRDPHSLDSWMRTEIERLAHKYQFFHWHLAFPEVFAQGGFNCVLGNPPWEKVELLQREWFAGVRPDLETIPAGKQKAALFDEFRVSDPHLYEAFIDATRASDGERSFIQHSGRYPLCGQGRINSYAAFAESTLQILGSAGLAGFVLPPGIATDDSTKFFIQHIVENDLLKCFYAFTNRGYIFPEIESTLSFALITYGRNEGSTFKLAAQLWQVDHLSDEGRSYSLDRRSIRQINPNTLNLPIFQSAKDALLVSDIHRRIPILQEENVNNNPKLRIGFRQGLFNMTTDKNQFESLENMQSKGFALTRNVFSLGKSVRFLPLYEAKLTGQFNHRHGTFDGVPEAERFGTRAQTNKPRLVEDLQNPNWMVIPRYWVDEEVVNHRTPADWEHHWFLGFRNAISAVADFRSVAFSVIPHAAVGNSMPLLFCYGEPFRASLLLANFNAFVLDYVCRQKASGGNLNFYVVKQLPILSTLAYDARCPWSDGKRTLMGWLLPRVLELTYTAWDMAPFSQDCGLSGPPFRWDEERRFMLRSELDAAFFHLYLPALADGDWCPAESATAKEQLPLKASFPTPRDAVDYILDTFPIVKRRDEQKQGEYRTKRVILEIYDAMAEASRTGVPYQTRLDPPPADPSCCHPKKKIGILAFGSLITDPGPELQSSITMRIKTNTPFPVEYARINQTRGGAPTLVPHESGGPVSAEILVLDDDTPIAKATDILWRRERRKEDTGETYSRGTSENSVLVEEFHDDTCVSTVLRTDFNPSGKASYSAAELAKRAIASVAAAPTGMDGISYLINAIRSGIETPLTAEYKTEILKRTVTLTLEEALKTAKGS